MGQRSGGGARAPPCYRERTFYAGSATLVLALVGLPTPGGWRRKAPFAVLAALGVAIALRTPGLCELVIHAAAARTRPEPADPAVVRVRGRVLAAFGTQAVIDATRDSAAPGDGRGRRPSRCRRGGRLARRRPRAARCGTSSHRSVAVPPAALALASVGWWLAGVAALAAVMLLVAPSGRTRARRRLLVALVALDLLHFAHGYNGMGPASIVLPPRPPAIACLQRHEDGGRIAAVEPAFSDDTPTLYGLHDVRGYDVPQPSFRFFELMRLGSPGADPWGLAALTPVSPRALGLLGARYVLVAPGVHIAYPDLRPVYRGDDATIYENALAAPRTFVPRAVRIVSGAEQELATIGEDRFDARRAATLRAAEIDGAPPPSTGAGTTRVVGETNASVTLRASLAHRGLVVLNDTWAPGWSVQVDGRAAQALQTNAVLRGVVVPAGTHEIVWRYRVPGLRLGGALSGIALLLSLAWAGMLARRWRRPLPPEAP